MASALLVSPIPILIWNDLEFSGNKITRNFVSSWGSAIQNNLTGEILETDLVLFNKPFDSEWEPSTYEWAKKNIPEEVKRLDTTRTGHGKYSGTILKEKFLEDVIKKYTNNDRKLVTFGSDTSASDNCWMNYYLSLNNHQPIQTWFGCDYHKDPICIDTWYRGLLGLEITGRYNEIKLLREKLRIPDEQKSTAVHDHNPVNDCIHMAQEYWIIKCAVEAKQQRENERILNIGDITCSS